MYHVELREFPHNLCHFNLTEPELRPLIEMWARGQSVEAGERTWSPLHARLTILEGPRVENHQLTMGRGWRAAERSGEDVTGRLLAAARAAAGMQAGTGVQAPAPSPSPVAGADSAARAPAPGPDGPAADLALAGDSLGLELLALLKDEDPQPIALAWRLASTRWPERPASECLALAEHALRSLLARRLIALLAPAPNAARETARDADDAAEVGEGELERLLRAPESWLADDASPGVRMRRR